MPGGERDCVLYVDGDDRDRLMRHLHDRLGGAVEGSTLTVAGVQVRVGRNTARLDTGPLAEFANWPTLVEAYPELEQPDAAPASVSVPGPAAGDPAGGEGPAGMVAVVAEVMTALRRAGNRVVAVCDFED